MMLAATLVAAALGAMVASTLGLPAHLPASADGGPVWSFGTDGVVIDDGLAQPGQTVFARSVVGDRTGGLIALVTVFVNPGPNLAQVLVKYTPAGLRDASFGSNGVFRLPETGAEDIAVSADGSVLVGGAFGRRRLLLVDPKGLGSTPIGPIARFDFQTSDDPRVDRLLHLGDGRILAIRSGRTVLVVHPNHVVDQVAGMTGASSAHTLGRNTGVVLSDGRVLMTLEQFVAGSQICDMSVFTADLQLDPSFGVAGFATRSGACGRVFAAPSGGFLSAVVGPAGTPVAMRRYTAAGTEIPALALPGARSIVVEGTGRILATRWDFPVPGEGIRTAVAAYRSDGSVDPTFGDGTGVVYPTQLPLGAWVTVLDGGDLALTGILIDTPHRLYLAIVDSPWGPAPQPPALPMTAFTAVLPTRVLDTRDGTGAPMAALPQGGQIDLRIAGRGGVPDTPDIAAVVLNVTATEASAPGFVSVWPTGSTRPGVSSLNLERAGQTNANQVTVRLGASGSVSLFSQAGTHLVADVLGYYRRVDGPVAAGRFNPIDPRRVLDTREGLGAPRGQIGAGEQIDVQIGGVGPIPSAGVSAVVFNLTATNAATSGFFTAWPAGVIRPAASNLNLASGETRANLVVVPLGAGGRVSIFSQSGADVIADVAGYFTDSTEFDDVAGLFVPIEPRRIIDSRFGGDPRVAGGTTLTKQVGSTLLAPPYGATWAVVANITVTDTTGAGFFTAWPSGTLRPIVSNLNASATGQTVPNAAVVALESDSFDLYVQSDAHVVVDLFGYYLAF